MSHLHVHQKVNPPSTKSPNAAEQNKTQLFEEHPAGRCPLSAEYTVHLIDQDSEEPLSTHQIFGGPRDFF
jgi:hypothetical protein